MSHQPQQYQPSGNPGWNYDPAQHSQSYGTQAQQFQHQQVTTYSPGAHPAQQRPLGQIRNSWACIGLAIITFGIYSLVWIYKSFSEMQRHRGSGTGGGVAVLLSFVPFVSIFLTPSEVGQLYAASGRPSPVSGATGFWTLLPFVGSLIWFLKTNGALNDYWAAMGVGRHPQFQSPAYS